MGWGMWNPSLGPPCSIFDVEGRGQEAKIWLVSAGSLGRGVGVPPGGAVLAQFPLVMLGDLVFLLEFDKSREVTAKAVFCY